VIVAIWTAAFVGSFTGSEDAIKQALKGWTKDFLKIGRRLMMMEASVNKIAEEAKAIKDATADISSGYYADQMEQMDTKLYQLRDRMYDAEENIYVIAAKVQQMDNAQKFPKKFCLI